MTPKESNMILSALRGKNEVNKKDDNLEFMGLYVGGKNKSLGAAFEICALDARLR